MLVAIRTLVLGVAAPADLRPDDRGDHRDHRRQVQKLGDPVAGVGEHGHVFSAAERSQRPRQVNATIMTSMTIWERVAARAEP